MIGQTFGSYQILEKRGEGGMGMFFKAKDLQLDRIVGLKTLRPELLADAALRERLQTEAKSLARLVHQNIANVLHYLVVGENNFIVMEYVEGLDLADIVRRTGLVPMQRLGPIVAQICAAISYAHSKNVIHRDLKPSNIMVTEDWSVKVTDFGIAKILGDKAQTRTGMAAGSLHYMAPEQIRATGVDARTDIYQLGATLYELTAGRRPFVSDSEYELMTMQLQDTPPPPSSVNPRVSTALDAVILRALAKNPGDRYQNAMELNVAYQAALANTASAAAGEMDAHTIGQFPVSASERPTTVTPSSEAKTTIAPSRAKPRREVESPTPQRAAPEPERKLWPWLAGGGAIVAAVLLYLLWPSGPGQKQGTVVDGGDTSATVSSTSTAACTLQVHARVPAGISDAQVIRAELTVNHPQAGLTKIPVTVANGMIDHSVTVQGISEVSLTVQGFDRNDGGLFSGATVVNAPQAGLVDVTIPLSAAVGLATGDGTQGTDTDGGQTGQEKPASATLTITVTPFDARSRVERVWIDGTEAVGSDLFEHKIAPGRHSIRFKVGDDLLTDTVTIGSDGTTEKNLFVGSNRGKLTVTADFGAEGGSADITLDGQATGKGTPGLLRDILEGPHEVTVKQQGFRSREGSRIVYVQAGDEVKVSFNMVKR